MHLKNCYPRLTRKTFLYITYVLVIGIYIYSVTRSSTFSNKVKYAQFKIIRNQSSSRERKEFTTILNTNCNVTLNGYPLNCLKNIKAYDKKYARKKTCKECFYDATTSSKLIIYHHAFWDIQMNNLTCYKFQMRILKLNIMSYLATQNLC
jgi:hypothetical protein